MPLNLRATQFDLALTIDTEVEHSLALSYSTELFAPATAQAMLDNYMHLLERLHRSSRTGPCTTMRPPSPEDLARLAAWNQTDSAYPRDLTVHGLLGRSSARRPARRSCRLPGEALGYPELWSRVRPPGPRAARAAACSEAAWSGLCLERDAGDGGRATRDPERGRRLCAAGPGLPAAAAARHGPGRGADAAADRAGSRRPVAGPRRADAAAGPGAGGTDGAARHAPCRPTPSATPAARTRPTSSTPRAPPASPRAWWCRTGRW